MKLKNDIIVAAVLALAAPAASGMSDIRPDETDTTAETTEVTDELAEEFEMAEIEDTEDAKPEFVHWSGDLRERIDGTAMSLVTYRSLDEGSFVQEVTLRRHALGESTIYVGFNRDYDSVDGWKEIVAYLRAAGIPARTGDVLGTGFSAGNQTLSQKLWKKISAGANFPAEAHAQAADLGLEPAGSQSSDARILEINFGAGNQALAQEWKKISAAANFPAEAHAQVAELSIEPTSPRAGSQSPEARIIEMMDNSPSALREFLSSVLSPEQADLLLAELRHTAR